MVRKPLIRLSRMRAISSASGVSAGRISGFHFAALSRSRSASASTPVVPGPVRSTISTREPSAPRPISSAGTRTSATMPIGPSSVIARNHLDRTRSTNSRRAITSASRRPETRPRVRRPAWSGGLRPALGDRGAGPDPVDEDLVQRRDDHLEPLQRSRRRRPARRAAAARSRPSASLTSRSLPAASPGPARAARAARRPAPDRASTASAAARDAASPNPSAMMPSAASRRWMSASLPSSSFLPRAMMQMWSTSFSACSIWWVENSTVRPLARISSTDLAQHLGVDRVEAAPRLVEDHQLGLVDQRGRELDLLLHALATGPGSCSWSTARGRADRATARRAGAASLRPRPRSSPMNSTMSTTFIFGYRPRSSGR